MRPSSELEALRILKSSRFTIDGSVIKCRPGGDLNDLSVRQSDIVAFLCHEHGYSYSDSPQPMGEVKRPFQGWLDAEVQLARVGFRYAKQGENFLIVAPDGIRVGGWIRYAIDYLCHEWNYTYE